MDPDDVESLIDELEDILNRMYNTMTGQKKKELMQLLAQYETQREGLVDIFWSLLNSSEFLFNH